ncbi:GNAT family N-acetyltransferase [Sphingomonas endophytica]|uniref:RimJ/RimL family protein N-acetyltransferase n=1 Tax=Sphingomonas endophytica TaxID=869719 RepID=A0ABR6N4U7_9SPHN|nr:GNAT family N-acetyltransferase [Sphingomonas endophytica]MBB5724842.1 RimJ/RimL family protein N-acetyltransferase [Sphingomonas endophytica]
MFALTPRLTLRPGWFEDAPALAQAIGHEAVVNRLARAPCSYTPADAETFLSLPRGATEPRFVIVERSGDHRLIGGIGLHRAENGDHELGYWLTPNAWGRGYATEAGRAVLAIARHALPLTRLTAYHHADNPASGAVLRKLGFVETGRSQRWSLARGGTVAAVDFALDLDAAAAPFAGTMPIAA